MINEILFSSGDITINSANLTFIKYKYADKLTYPYIGDRITNGSVVSTSINLNTNYSQLTTDDKYSFSYGQYDPYAKLVYTEISDFKIKLIIKVDLSVTYNKVYNLSINLHDNTTKLSTDPTNLDNYIYFRTYPIDVYNTNTLPDEIYNNLSTIFQSLIIFILLDYKFNCRNNHS